MKTRLLTNWTLSRFVYLGIGIILIAQSAMTEQYWGMALGGYLASMGLFAFGCAAGNCRGGSCAAEPKQQTNDTPAA